MSPENLLWYSAVVVDGVQSQFGDVDVKCENCALYVRARDLDKHQGSRGCKIVGSRKRALHDGYERWSASSIARGAGIARDVEAEGHHTGDGAYTNRGKKEVWAPVWAGQVMKMISNAQQPLEEALLHAPVIVERLTKDEHGYEYRYGVPTKFKTYLLHLSKDEDFRTDLATLHALGSTVTALVRFVEHYVCEHPDLLPRPGQVGYP